MMTMARAAALVAMLGLAACSNPLRGGGQADDGLFGPVGPGAGAGAGLGMGSASDPTSIAYFNQTVGDRVFFAFDQSSLSSEAIATLQRQVAWLQQNSQYPILIEGHADERGTREYNLALGARRAASVRDFMVSQGIPDSRISTITYGKERPVAGCSNESCWSQNRRAVTVISTQLGS